jgi:3-hydroxyisobutyrate dehydrogenase
VSEIRRVGFVGLGNMGGPMARNVARAGFELVLRDANAELQQSLAGELVATAAPDPSPFAEADAVVTMLPTGAIVRDVVLDWGLADALRPGTPIVDMSSSVPTGTVELGAILAEKGIPLVDAPVSGGVARAVTAELAIMVGGDDEDAVERVRPVLEAMGARLFRTGPLGSGHAMKALNNIVAASAFAASVEALLTGRRFGLDPAAMIDVMNASTGRTFNSENVLLPHVVEGAFATGFALPLMTKDIVIAADLAREMGIDAPTLELMRERWSRALDAEGDVDFTHVAEHWAAGTGVELTRARAAE